MLTGSTPCARGGEKKKPRGSGRVFLFLHVLITCGGAFEDKKVVRASFCSCSDQHLHRPCAPSPLLLNTVFRPKVAVLGRHSSSVRRVGRMAEGRLFRCIEEHVQPYRQSAGSAEGGPPRRVPAVPSYKPSSSQVRSRCHSAMRPFLVLHSISTLLSNSSAVSHQLC